ncbi:MAG: hypothetical protein JXI33_00365 [Candidatus Aminicenantes bacterium]|nr:hypothetical protein [Candidatus Aminicenantes bacterium]
MGAFNFLSFIAIACVIWSIVTAIRITMFLDRRGLKTPGPFWGFYIFRNLGDYRKTSIQEDGKIGPLYYQYVIPINVALFCALAALGIRSLAK